MKENISCTVHEDLGIFNYVIEHIFAQEDSIIYGKNVTMSVIYINLHLYVK